jgi:hypothetical protein
MDGEFLYVKPASLFCESLAVIARTALTSFRAKLPEEMSCLILVFRVRRISVEV